MITSRDGNKGGLGVRPIADSNPLNLRRCTHPDCREPFYARQMCESHYMVWYRAGKPDHLPAPPERQRLPASFKFRTG
jgi:hypothetical protein